MDQLGAEVGQGGPGDQHGGDEGEHAEDAHDNDGVAGFEGTENLG